MKKLTKKEGGVSEVIGSILILMITVVLFSTVFYYVASMPTPKPQVFTQFEAQMELVNVSGNMYANITVKNIGGESLDDWRTMFIIVVDFTAKQHMLSEGNFSTQPFDKDGRFSQGESFYYNTSWDNLTVNPYSDISITLYDKSTGQIIWSSHLQGHGNLPPTLISLTSSPAPIRLGQDATLKAVVFNPNGNNNVSGYTVALDFSVSDLRNSVNVSHPNWVKMSYGGRFFTVTLGFADNKTLKPGVPYKVRVFIDDHEGHNVSYFSYLFVTRGTNINGPDLYIDSSLITLSSLTPQHGSNVVVTVVVQNLGGVGAYFKLRVYDVFKGYPYNPSIGMNATLIQTNLGSSKYLPSSDINKNYSVAAAGQTTISFVWINIGTNESGKVVVNNGHNVSHVAGTHQLYIEVVNITPPEDPHAHYPNHALVKLTVLPRILLVDDDKAPGGSPLDTSKYYKYILNTCGYKYDEINGESGVSSSKLDQYDLVIWETGYDDKNVLTQLVSRGQDQASVLKNFYEGGGALWLISQGISNSAFNTLIGLTNYNTSSVKRAYALSSPDINLMIPNSTNYVNATLINRADAENGNLITYVKSLNSWHPLFAIDSWENPKEYASIYADNSNGGKFVYLGFELSRVQHYYTQDFIAYRILNWLGNITGRVGNDLAIDDMNISPRNALYMEPVKITVVVSNNGGKPLSSEVLLQIDGAIPLNITKDPNSTGVICPDGGYVYVNFTWIPTSTGKHLITAMVDPYNTIKETNENNNIINENIIDNAVYVHFSTLIVYNASSKPQDVRDLENTSQDLGYNYHELNVNTKQSWPSNYRSGDYFLNYNLIIWAVSSSDSLGSSNSPHVEAIKNTITHPTVGFMFIGRKAPDALNTAKDSGGNTLLSYLGISYEGTTSLSSGILYGVNNNTNPSNGLAFIINGAGNKLQVNPSSSTVPLFDRYAPTNSNLWYLENLSRIDVKNPIDGWGVAGTYPGKFVVLSFNWDDIAGLFGTKSWSTESFTTVPYSYAPQVRAQLLYRLYNYFGEVKDMPELATYPWNINITYGGVNPYIPPIVGRSYMLRTTVYNYGSVGASTVVRFYDDFEWIGSKTVYVPSQSSVPVEIVWTPMFAGHARHIRVIVDPLGEVQETQWNRTPSSIPLNVDDEIFNFNNEAIRTVTVYYFWDNMENGASNWMHEATVLDINGESPLDFINRKDVSTNVTGDWDWGLSGGSDNSGNAYPYTNIFNTTDTRVSEFTKSAHHSSPNAFWMPEVPRVTGEREPIDVIFVIDTSGSMDETVPGANVGDENGDGKENTRLDVAINASWEAIRNNLGDNDRVAIFAFDQNGNGHPEKILDFTYVTTKDLNGNGKPDREDIYEALHNLQATGGTPLYDTISWAVYYMDNNQRQNAIKGILVLTDGISNVDDYGTSNGQQYKYAPGTGSNRNHVYEAEPGPIQLYTDGDGLLNIPYNVMTISIAPNGWDGRLFALGNSSTGRISMALFDSKPQNIEGAFTTFIQLLIKSSMGGLKATPPSTFSNAFKSLETTGAILDLGVVVFSDGFRNYTNTPDDANTPGFYGKWTQSGFTIASDNDENYYYKSQSADGWINKYWVAQTDSSGAYLSHTIYPLDVLKYHYPGSYTIKGATLNFWVGANENDLSWWGSSYPDATINIYINGHMISQLTNVLSNTVEDYYTVEIPSWLQNLPSYNINITVENTQSTMAIDDVMVVYYVDYTPPSAVSGDYSQVINTGLNYTYLITPSVSVYGVKSANLTFWTKYWMTQGTNGGIIYLWGSNDADSWSWSSTNRIYLTPTQSYTGNLNISQVDKYASSGGPVIKNSHNGLEDKFGHKPYWCFNGISGSGTFGWDYISVDLTPYLNQFKYIRIVFMLVQFGGLAPSGGWNPAMGWYLDDVKISISSDGARDMWQLHNFGAHGSEGAQNGNYAWAFGDASDNWALPKGVDASLITKQIDLTTARSAILFFWIRFNINPAAGVPPATVRVEISDDNGRTWNSITYGVRIGWGTSGKGGMAGESIDGNYGWVNSTTLMRINCDLSGWAGETIEIRFRVVTNNTDYPTYNTSADPAGVFIDDVEVYGEGYAPTLQVNAGNTLWHTTTQANPEGQQAQYDASSKSSENNKSISASGNRNIYQKSDEKTSIPAMIQFIDGKRISNRMSMIWKMPIEIYPQQEMLAAPDTQSSNSLILPEFLVFGREVQTPSLNFLYARFQ